ncbi:MAG: ABC transporter permease [Corynebacteriales bacterium]|nr:ABC transporter permease [Mycobacteriales bacterium]
MEHWFRLAVGGTVLVAIAVAVLGWYGVRQRGPAVRATLRAVLQLAVVALVLRGAITNWSLAAVVVAIMFTVAVVTAARRLRTFRHAVPATLVACGCGATVAVGVIVGVPILDRDPKDLLAVSGIIIGGCMTAATLTGRNLLTAIAARDNEVEAWLSIGATRRQALIDLCRTAVFEALVPGLDQTRTVGLVTLPGAFVGAILAGAGAEQAARFQLAVLTGLICAQSITAVTLASIVGGNRSSLRPETGNTRATFGARSR